MAKIRKKIESCLQEVFEQYMWMFFPTLEERGNLTDEWRKSREVAMPVFINYFNTTPLMYQEQIIKRIHFWFTPFTEFVEERTGLPLRRMLEVVLWIQSKIQEGIDRVFELREIADRERARFLEEAKAQGWDLEAMRLHASIDPVKDAHLILLEAIDKLFIINQTDIEKAFPEREVDQFVAFFAAKRGEFSGYWYPTEMNPAELYPLFCIRDGSFFCTTPHILLLAMLRRVEALLCDSPRKDIFLRHRDHAVEEKTAELFKRFLPTASRIWRNVCEMPTGEFEHDLLIQLENRFLVVESKATQPKEPFRDPDRAYLRI